MKGDGGVGKGSGGTSNGSTNANIIASGQAFFVKAVNHASTLTFYETAKATAQPASGFLLMGTPAQSAVVQYMRLILQKDSVNNDDMLVFFNSTASTKYSPYEDAEYRPGPGAPESLASISSDSVKLAINRLPFPNQKASLTIPLSVTATASGQYSLIRTDLKSIPPLYDIWLMDNYKKDSLDIRNNTTYVFNIDLTDPASFGINRFSLVIRENPALGLRLLNFTAAKTPAGAQVVWKTENEQNYTNFTVERSSDGGITFDVLGGFLSSDLGTYSFPDKNPPVGSDQYRLKLEDVNGAITYSGLVTLIYGNGDNTIPNNISVYPNPASGVINLAINQSSSTGPTDNLSALQTNSLMPSLAAIPTGSPQLYSIKIMSITGSVIASATSAQNTWQTNVGSLPPGTYIIQVVNSGNNAVVGKSTFVKM